MTTPERSRRSLLIAMCTIGALLVVGVAVLTSFRMVSAVYAAGSSSNTGQSAPEPAKPAPSTPSAPPDVDSPPTADAPLVDGQGRLTEPAIPGDVHDPSAAGARATATYFLSLFPYLYETDDSVAWSALSSPECAYCNDVARGVAEARAKGPAQDRYSQVITVDGITGPTPDRNVEVAVTVDYTQSENAKYDGGLTVTRVLGETTTHYVMTLEPVQHGWRIRAIREDPPQKTEQPTG